MTADSASEVSDALRRLARFLGQHGYAQFASGLEATASEVATYAGRTPPDTLLRKLHRLTHGPGSLSDVWIYGTADVRVGNLAGKLVVPDEVRQRSFDQLRASYADALKSVPRPPAPDFFLLVQAVHSSWVKEQISGTGARDHKRIELDPPFPLYAYGRSGSGQHVLMPDQHFKRENGSSSPLLTWVDIEQDPEEQPSAGLRDDSRLTRGSLHPSYEAADVIRRRPGTHQFLRWTLRPRGQPQDADYLSRLSELIAHLGPILGLDPIGSPSGMPLNATLICSVCGTASDQPISVPFSESAPPDLDARPVFDSEKGLSSWVQRCPTCGYCAHRISEPTNDGLAMLRNSVYQRQLGDPSLPPAASSFLCWSLILEASGQIADATLTCLYATWLVDDAGIGSASQTLRRKATELIKRAQRSGTTVDPMVGGDETIMVDLLRRAGRFDEAGAALAEALYREPEPILRMVLDFQRRLIARGDTAAHSLVEALTRRQASS